MGGNRLSEVVNRGFGLAGMMLEHHPGEDSARLNLRSVVPSYSRADGKLQKIWSGRPGSNRRRPAWEAGILPLNYSRLPYGSAS